MSHERFQISRHWRMNSQRYRLEGVRYENGQVSLQNRPAPMPTPNEKQEERSIQELVRANGHT
ncbi:MAG TPA: hypothetical protein VLH19_04515 [Patescibacteria group bacterium]|nr:hypothetical protein [Patescibacteria group bacterium]